MSTGVQLIGTKSVLARYDRLNCDAWALYQGKQFIVGGIGGDALSEWLQSFDQSGSTATYILRVYDCDEAPTSSTGNTDYVASLNFKVIDQYEGYGIAGHSNKLMDTIRGIQDEIKELKKPPTDDGEDEQTFQSVVMGWLEDPQKLNTVVGVARQILGFAAPAVTPALPQGQGIGSCEPGALSPVDAASEDGLTRISNALDILGKCDPDLVVHLEKLAKLAQTEPLIFKAVIGKLDTL